VFAGIFSIHSTAAVASGFALSEQSASGMGNAFAGAAAVAEDASTVYWNPAGMARLGRGSHFLIAGHAILPSTRFHNGASIPGVNRTDPGGEGGDAGDLQFIPNLYYVMGLDDRLSFGVGVNVPFGLATEYSADWIGRFQGIRSEIETVNINPSVSWKANDALAVGFGINWQHGKIDLLTGVNYSGLVFGTPLNALVPANSQGQNEVNVDGDAWGWNAGVLIDVSPATRLGLAYRSSVDYELSGSTRFSAVPAAFVASPALTAGTSNGNVRLDVETPDMASASLAHELSPRWTLLADLTWTGWSNIRALPLVRDTGATLDTLRFNFKDTLRYSLGANYRMNDAWLFRAGLAFDESPVPGAADRSVRLPDSDRTWLTFGGRYRLSNASAFDFGYAFIRLKDAPIDNNQNAGNVRGYVNGTYKASVNIVSVQYTRDF
jgi:long-chain fatty acid transport protein